MSTDTASHSAANVASRFKPAVSREGATASQTVASLGAELPPADFTFPKQYHAPLAIFVAIACVVGAIAIYLFIDSVYIIPAREAATIEEKISNATQTILPVLSSFIGKTDAEVMAALEASGGTYYEVSSSADSGDYEVMKLPENMTLADAAVLYATGISNLSATDAFDLLNGSWDLDIDRTVGEVLGLHWADFTSADAEEAVSAAAVAQGFELSQASAPAEDTSGNTYIEGTFMHNGATYTWRASAIELSEIYSISGLPDSSLYVGIRVTS